MNLKGDRSKRPWCKALPMHLFGVTEENHGMSEDDQCSGRDANTELPKYKSEALLLSAILFGGIDDIQELLRGLNQYYCLFVSCFCLSQHFQLPL